MAEYLDHITLSTVTFCGAIDAVKAGAPVGGGPVELGLMGRVVHQVFLTQRLPEYLRLDPNRVRVKTPMGSGLRLGVLLQVIPAHARRHLWQAARVL